MTRRVWLHELSEALWYLCQAIQRPKTRGDCIGAARPCPWASCKYHLLGEVTQYGTYRVRANTDIVPWRSLSFKPGAHPDEAAAESAASVLVSLEHTCALDVADSACVTGTETPPSVVAGVLRLSEWRTRLAERTARDKFRRKRDTFAEYGI